MAQPHGLLETKIIRMKSEVYNPKTGKIIVIKYGDKKIKAVKTREKEKKE